MLIQCTKKLLDELGIKPTVMSDELPLFSWHANLITINRRKTIVLVNDSNRYIIVLHGLKAKDFKNLNKILIDSIRETLLEECIKPEIVEKYISQSPKITYYKTKGRSAVAKLNKACETVQFCDNSFKSDTINQSDVSIATGGYLTGDGKGGYIYPNEILYRDLEGLAAPPIFSCHAVKLKITLDLENHDIWRRIIVPYHITFKKLHDILQTVFNWQDYHLHDFYILDGDEPVVNLVCGEDAFEYPNNVPMIIETGIKLSEYIPKHSRIDYTYDFGDNWQHHIEVEEIIENYTVNYPVCIEGRGNTPPEDVGGEGGYDEFLEAITDPDHPEHKAFIEWGKMQWYKDFDIDLVNRKLKRIMS